MQEATAGVLPPSEDCLSTTVCLSSSASTELFPQNTPTSFANQLPSTLTNRDNRKMFLRLKCISLARTSADPYRFSSGYVKIHLYEVEGQRRGREYAHCVAGFVFPPDPLEDGGEYGLHTFRHAPRLPIRFQSLDKLRVRLTDERDRDIRLRKGAPTLVWLSLDEMGSQEQFTVTSFSRQPDLFPANTPSRFTAPLPAELQLDDHEVALQNVIYPPRMEEEALASLRVNDKVFRYDLKRFPDTASFVRRVVLDVRFEFEGRLIFGVQERPGEHRGQAFLFRPTRRPGGGEGSDGAGSPPAPMRIYPSSSFTKAMGQVSRPRGATSLEEGRSFYFRGRPNLHLGLPHPLAMLQCSIISPNIMCGRRAELLQCVPVYAKKEFSTGRVYEPEVLTYHPVPDRPFGTINFEFVNPDATARSFVCENPEHGMLITLIFRRKERK